MSAEVEFAPPVPASAVQTGPVQTVPLRQVPVWEHVAERGCLAVLSFIIGALTCALATGVLG